MSGENDLSYEFGPFRLLPAERQLLRDGQTVALAPKDFDVLVALVRQSGHLVGKDELLKEVWPDSFVEEANLSRHVYALRRALGEDGAGRPYIETVPKRGYRFASSVRELSDGDSIAETVTRTRIIAEEEITLEGSDIPATTEPAPLVLPPSPAESHRRIYRVLFASLALLLIAAAIIFLVRYYRRAQPLTERDTILLADFDNRTGDEVFDLTLKQAVAVQLEQSPFLSIYPDQRMRDTLRYMGRAPDEKVTIQLAREICQRQGVKALITGSIVTLGSHYAITLEALNGLNGDSIGRAQVEADNKEHVLGRLGEATSQLRKKLGESITSIQKFDAPLDEATTSSLEALKAFSLGYKERASGNQLEAISLYKRAIEIDPNFALAYARLAIVYRNTFQPELAAQVSQKAFELRDRVSERERVYIAYTYYSYVTYEVDKAIEALELWARTYPNEATPHGNLAFQYINTRQFKKAVEEARESIRLDPNAPAAYSNLGSALVSLNRFDEAKTVCEQFLALKLDASTIHEGQFLLAFREGDAATMQRQIEWTSGRRDQYLGQKWQAVAAAHSGQSRKAVELFARASEMALKNNLKEPAASMLSTGAVANSLLGNCHDTKETAAKALALSRNSDNVWNSALALALCGENGSAQSVISDYAKVYPKDVRPNLIWMPITRAIAELQHDNPAPAIELLELSIQYGGEDFWWPEYFRGLAYLQLNKGEQATAEFQKILGQGWSISSPLSAPAQLGVARAALSADKARTRKAYEDFFVTWKDADPDILLLQQARKEYARL
jgi:eukaryotic-like serine/threonine-protein kinase